MTLLEKNIKQILTKHKLTSTKVIRLSNRFLVIKGKLKSQKVIFKILISQNQYEQDKAGQALIKEVKFLNFLQNKGTKIIKQSVNRIIDYQKNKHSWYLKNWLPGQSQKVIGSGWFFKDNFFTTKNVEYLSCFYNDLYQLSESLPADLQKIFTRSKLSDYENFIDWKNLLIFLRLANLPIKKDVDKIKKFIIRHRKIFDSQQNVINQYEPYADHLLTHKNKTAIIDWENVNFGDIAHDLAVVWLRAFNHPDWQKSLVNNFKHLPYFKELMNLQIVIQSVSNIRYFLETSYSIDEKNSTKIIKILQKFVKQALNDQII
ncbi:hypothetical protein KKF32_03745 [Patescibacteria group bacterium]|nr:hypothetical protein [Patescibacteria group bacterium]